MSSDLENPSVSAANPTGSPLPRLPASPPEIRVGHRIPPLPQNRPLDHATDSGIPWSSGDAEVPSNPPPSPPTSVSEPFDVGTPHENPSTGEDSADEEVRFSKMIYLTFHYRNLCK